jgi:predicted permease
LVAIQVALCTTLLAGAGLLLRSFLKLQHIDPGFRAAGLVQLWVNPVGPGSRNGEGIQQLYQEILRRVRALPGVESASAAITMPNAIAFTDNFRIEGQSADEAVQNPAVPLNWVDTDYFRTMGIPLKAGRWFDEDDKASTRQVAVVSETLARRYFPGESALGKRIAQGFGEPSREIVGVVGDAKYSGVARDWEPVYYMPSAQAGLVRWRYVVIRGEGDLMQLARAARREIQTLRGGIPVTRLKTVVESMQDSIQEPRLRTSLLGLFAAMALLLAASGIYGVMAYSVSQRTREFGVRLALGARGGDICGAVIREAVLITATGTAAGVSAALLLTRGVERFLFEVTPWDPLTYGSTVATLILTAVLASTFPAWKAMRVDPAVTLRQD